VDDQDLFWIGAILVGVVLWERWNASSPAQALQQGGAKIYDFVHPSQKAHANDLPGHQWTRARVIELARATGFPDPNLAAAIAYAESGGVPNALADTGREYSVGLWQINLKAWPRYGSREWLADPINNAKAAFEISKGGTDWAPWSVYKTGRYRSYL